MTEKSRQLHGVKADGTRARIGAEVHRFINDDNTMSVVQAGLNLVLETAKGKTYCKPHSSLNIWQGEKNGTKIRITKKVLVCTVTWWA